GARLLFEARSLEYVAPLLPIIIIVTVVIATYRRDLQMTAIAAILGGGLSLTLVAYLFSMVFPWYRFYILAIPAEVLLVGLWFAAPDKVVHGKAVSLPGR